MVNPYRSRHYKSALRITVLRRQVSGSCIGRRAHSSNRTCHRHEHESHEATRLIWSRHAKQGKWTLHEGIACEVGLEEWGWAVGVLVGAVATGKVGFAVAGVVGCGEGPRLELRMAKRKKKTEDGDGEVCH